MIFTVSKILLLLSISSSKILASSSSAFTKIEPDCKIQFKVPVDLPDARMDLYGGVEKVKSETENKKRLRDPILNYLNLIGGPLKELCDDTIKTLNSELENLNSFNHDLFMHNSSSLLSSASRNISNVYFKSFDFLNSYVGDVIAEEKQEWEIRKSIMYNHEIKSNLSYGHTSELENFKTAATKWLENPDLRNCEIKTINQSFKKEKQQIQNDIKMWLLAKQMIDGPNSVENRVPSEYIRPDWKLLVGKLNVPEDRFNLYPITKELNLYFLMNDLSLNFKESVERMKLELKKIEDGLIYKVVSSDFKEEWILRHFVITFVLKGDAITLETVKMRLKIIERFVQALIRYEQLNLSISNQNFAADELVIVKFWLMALQIFTENGWQSSKYGLKSYSKPQSTPEPEVSPIGKLSASEIKESATEVAPTKKKFSILEGLNKFKDNIFGKKP